MFSKKINARFSKKNSKEKLGNSKKVTGKIPKYRLNDDDDDDDDDNDKRSGKCNAGYVQF